MENIPHYISGTFIAVVIACIGFIFYAVNLVAVGRKNFTPTIVLSILCIWCISISILAVNGIFQDFSMPPRIFLFTATSLLVIIILLFLKKSRSFLNKLPITSLTYIHIVRVPVELVLLWLGVIEAIPMEMTFEGANFDILSGITAPFIAVFMLSHNKRHRLGAIIWNLVALGLLINIVTRAILATPYFYEPLPGGTPANIAVFSFPFVLLPTFVVPIVLFCHLVSLNQLLFAKYQSHVSTT